jgi:hypothetical protein
MGLSAGGRIDGALTHEEGRRTGMTISAKKWSQKQKDIAKNEQKVLFMWDMDKRYVPDPNDQSRIQVCGAMSRDRARRIWEIIQEQDNS